MHASPSTPHDSPHFRIYGEYRGTEPAFFDARAFPWTDVLQRHWTVIREEFEAHVARGARELRPNFVPDAVEITGWRRVNLFTFLLPNRAACRDFPRSVAALQAIPDLASAFINVLEPHSHLPPHHGDSNLLYRAHLGLVVPGDVDACGIEVDGTAVGWREGEVLLFNDAREHCVWNRSDRPRVVLVCDVIKPQHGGATPRACARVLGAIVVTFLQARVPLFRRLPRRVVRAVHAAAAVPFRLYLACFGMQRRLRAAESPRAFTAPAA